MSWNTGLQVNNLATKLNNLSKSVITNPLTSTLNANTQSISNVSNIAIQSLKDSTGTNGTTDQILAVAPSGLSVWKSPIVSTVFYVDGTSGNNANLGSQTFPFKTIQYALNKCVGSSIYYTIYVNPAVYAEDLTISSPRVNLIGVQSSLNTKSVYIKTISITTIAISGPTLDIIAIQNFLIGSEAFLDFSPITVSNSITNGGGYSLYISNCELTAPQPTSVIAFGPNNLNTRLYLSRSNINNVAGVNGGQNMVYMERGQLWQFDYVNITNKSSVNTLGSEVSPMYFNTNSSIAGGITNSNFTSENQGICIVINTTNSNSAFTIANNLFNFKTVVQGTGATNLYSCIVSAVKTTFALVNNVFVNSATTSALSQQPFILLSAGSQCFSRYNSFTMKYAPTNSAEAIIYPVGNYGTNATTNYYIYINGVYTNGAILYTPIPNYPVSATVVSSLQISDAQQLTNLNNLVLTNKSNIVGYDTTTKLLTYQPNNTITGLASATKTNVVGYDTGTGLLTYQSAIATPTPTYLWYRTRVDDSSRAVKLYRPTSTTAFGVVNELLGGERTFYSYENFYINPPDYTTVGNNFSSNNWTPVWGTTASTRAFLYFPSVGTYTINWGFAFNQSVIYVPAINKNWVLSDYVATPADVSTTQLACNSMSPLANFVSNLNATITILNPGVGGDYVSFSMYVSTTTTPATFNTRGSVVITKTS